MAERNMAITAHDRIGFRIGINVGDIVVEDGDIFGDGVNVATRLEALAEPGGICVSARVQEDAAGRLDLAFEDIGEQQLKNIARLVRAYRIRIGPASAAVGRPTLALPDKPSIAVLPFANLSGDPEQEYFADGMVEEIVTALSRIRWLFVIARNSSFAYKGRAGDVKQVGRDLGVRYVLEGSVRKGGGRVRITAQLVDALSGAHLWADRFEGSLEDVFDLQDEVAISVAGVIEPALRQAEIERARRKRPDSLDAYDLYLRALPLLSSRCPRPQTRRWNCSSRPSRSSQNTAWRTRSSPFVTKIGTYGQRSARKRSSQRCTTRASRSPRAATMPRRLPSAPLSSASSNATMRPLSTPSTRRLC